VRARLPRILGLVALVALVLAASAAAGNGGASPISPSSPNAGRISDIYWVIIGICAGILVLVEVTLVLFIVRFRSRGRGREVEGPQVRGHHRLELAWTALPILLLAVITAFTFYKLPGINDVPAAGATGSQLRMTVEGRQFYWEYTYPNGVVAVNHVQIPVGRPIRLEVTAPATDVIHSWWVPELAGKVDAVPGHPNHTWFEAERPGLWRLKCAEFCGIQHAMMLGTVQAVPAQQFDSWLADQARGQQAGTSALGEQTFEGACATCHGAQGQGGVGPDISGSAILKDRNALGDLLEHGRGQMPAVGHGWPDRQKDALFAYVSKHVAVGGSSGGGNTSGG
jgi:cytochrome c oxidase subunit 2